MFVPCSSLSVQHLQLFLMLNKCFLCTGINSAFLEVSNSKKVLESYNYFLSEARHTTVQAAGGRETAQFPQDHGGWESVQARNSPAYANNSWLVWNL